jgi:hypothetical protein
VNGHPARVVNVCLEEVSAGVLAALVPQRDQAAEMNRDVVGLAVVCVLYLSEARTTRTTDAGMPRCVPVPSIRPAVRVRA